MTIVLNSSLKTTNHFYEQHVVFVSTQERAPKEQKEITLSENPL